MKWGGVGSEGGRVKWGGGGGGGAESEEGGVGWGVKRVEWNGVEWGVGGGGVGLVKKNGPRLNDLKTFQI